MRDIGNPAAITAKRFGRGGKLKANPATKNQPCRQIDKAEKHNDDEKTAHRRLWVKHQIGSQNTGNAA